MEKEFKEMLKNLKEMLEIVENSDIGKAKEKFSNMLEEAINQPCKITIEKNKGGKCNVKLQGNELSLLLTLAGAEENILKRIYCEQETFDFIKTFVGSKEVD